jgi:hypothetical protein
MKGLLKLLTEDPKPAKVRATTTPVTSEPTVLDPMQLTRLKMKSSLKSALGGNADASVRELHNTHIKASTDPAAKTLDVFEGIYDSIVHGANAAQDASKTKVRQTLVNEFGEDAANSFLEAANIFTQQYASMDGLERAQAFFEQPHSNPAVQAIKDKLKVSQSGGVAAEKFDNRRRF